MSNLKDTPVTHKQFSVLAIINIFTILGLLFCLYMFDLRIKRVETVAGYMIQFVQRMNDVTQIHVFKGDDNGPVDSSD